MGKTMFHVVNAYTQAAQFEGLSASELMGTPKITFFLDKIYR